MQGILISLIVTTLCYITGIAFQLQLFTGTDGSVLWTFLFVYELAWLSLAFCVALFTVGVLVGHVFHCLCIILELCLLYHLGLRTRLRGIVVGL